MDTLVTRGSNATFTCSAVGNGTLKIKWRLPFGKILGSFQFEIYTRIRNLSICVMIENSWSINSSLSVTNITGDDGGNYTCIVENEVGETEATAVLSVSLYISGEQIGLNTTSGASENITCMIEGFPIIYLWEKMIADSSSGSGVSGSTSGNDSDVSGSGSGSGSGISGSGSGISGSGSASGISGSGSGSGVSGSGSGISGSGVSGSGSGVSGSGISGSGSGVSGSGVSGSGSGVSVSGSGVSGSGSGNGVSSSSCGGGIMSDEYREVSTGRVLEFDPAKFGDEGVYRCVARSGVGDELVSDPITVTSE